MGDSALYNNGIDASASGDAERNVAIGSKALFSNTKGQGNSAVGFKSMFSNISGVYNSALGDFALYFNQTGHSNTAVGQSALYKNTTGGQNTAIGQLALFSNTTGADNAAGGVSTLASNTTGNLNAGFGRFTLGMNQTGNSNTALGSYADVATGNLSNATALGNSTIVNASSKIRIGNGAVAVIEGQVDWTFPSDARFKFNIHDESVPGLALINKLRPVTYQFDTRKFDEHLMQNMPDSIRQCRMAGQDYRESSARVQTGFLAQEVEKACQELNFDFSGLHVPTSEVDNYGLAYGSFVPLLVKAVQEQQAEIKNLEIRNLEIEKLKAENATLKSQLDTQAAQLQQITAALQTAGISLENR